MKTAVAIRALASLSFNWHWPTDWHAGGRDFDSRTKQKLMYMDFYIDRYLGLGFSLYDKCIYK